MENSKIYRILNYKLEWIATIMPINIREATVKDLETLYKIETECFTSEAFTKKQIAYFLNNPDSTSLTAWINSELAGFIIGIIYENKETKIGRILTIDVAVKHRRKGIGLKLLQKLEESFIEKGASVCYLEVRTNNVAAHELYKQYGYTRVGILENYYNEGTHGIRLKKTLR